MSASIRQLRGPICAWLRANGLDPNRIPTYAMITIGDGKITTDQLPDGPVKVTPDGRVVYETITVPLIEQPPAEIAEALRLHPRCSECGR